MSRAARFLAVACPIAFALSSAPGRAQLTDLGAIVLDACDAPADCLANELFGKALAAGDFDGDGFDDLAVGVEETVSGEAAAGEVHVFYGSDAGLTLAGAQRFNAATSGVPGVPEAGDRFGYALGAEDFNADDFDDLAIGVPFEDIDSVVDAGAVIVLFGSASGLVTTAPLSLNQNVLPSGSAESAEENDLFGYSLEASFRELAIGVPGETFIPVLEEQAGRIHVLVTQVVSNPLGSVTDHEQNDFLSDCGATDGNELLDFWGAAIAQMNTGGIDLYAIGGGFESHSGIFLAGRVTQGFAQFSACFDQNTPGVLETAEEGDMFGSTLASADFNNDDFPDLAIAAPLEQYDDQPHRRLGGVNVLFGGFDGLTTTGDLHFSQLDFPPFPDFGEPEEQFGQALATGDFDNDHRDDLAIGGPFEDLGSALEAGTIHVAYGDSTGFNESRNQTFHSNFPAGMPDSPQTNDHFGEALASADFDGNGTDDLAIGMPGEDLGSQNSAGAVTVLYGLDGETGAFSTVQHNDNAVTVSESLNFGIFLVSRLGSAVVAATVNHARTGGTASPGVDFSYTNGSESWGVGDLANNTILVNIHEDTVDEPNETLVIALSNPSAGTALGSPATLTITITDNDVAGSLQFAQPVSVFAESAGTALVNVVRSGGAASAVTVHYATANGTATAGSDYVATSGTLTWGAGETVQSIEVELLDDGDGESTEVLLIQLSAPGGGATLGTFTTHQMVILGDEIFVDGFESGDTAAWSEVVP